MITKKIITKKPKRKNKLVLKPKKSSSTPKKVDNALYEEHLDINTFKRTPISCTSIKKLASELVQWARNDPDALIIKQFYVKHGLCGTTIKLWCEKYPEWAKAIKIAKMAIGTRRELGAMKREFSEGMVKNSLPFYGDSWNVDEDYKKLEEWRAELRKAIAEAKGTGEVHVHMDSFVPEKQEDE